MQVDPALGGQSGAVHVIAAGYARTVRYMHPESARLAFHEMTPDDLDDQEKRVIVHGGRDAVIHAAALAWG